MPKYTVDSFSVNQAWIIFQISETPVMTESEGDYHIYALMDAASAYILGNEFVSVSAQHVSQNQMQKLLHQGFSQADRWPDQLLIQNNEPLNAFEAFAEHLSIKYQRVSMADIWPIVGEAVQGFREYLEQPRMQ